MQGFPALSLRLKLKRRCLQDYRFDSETVTIGRDPEADVPLDNAAISRSHAKITRAPDGYYLEDLGSANGTYLNGVLVKRAKLYADDVILIGKFVLQVGEGELQARPVETSAGRSTTDLKGGSTVITRHDLASVLAIARECQPDMQEPELVPFPWVETERVPAVRRVLPIAILLLAVVVAFALVFLFR